MSSITLPRITDHAKSAALLAEAQRFSPGGVHSGRRHTTPAVCPMTGAGARFTDADGNEYIDFQAAYGAVFLGHNDTRVEAAVRAPRAGGVLYGLGTTDIEVEASRLIVRSVPGVEQVVLLNTGTETVQHAMRLARAVTGKRIVLKPQGGFNGGHDGMLLNILSAPEHIGQRDPGSLGMLASTMDGTGVFRFNDLADLERVFSLHDGDVAAVVLEPILHNAPSLLPLDGYLRGVRDLCDDHGALLVYDELLTGFRHALGGYQSVCGVLPDLTCLGKALGNGYTVSALGGPADLMRRFTTHPDGSVFLGGTYNGGAVGAVAAVAVLGILTDEPPYGHVFALGDTLRDGLRKAADEAGHTVVVSGYGSLLNVTFLDAIPAQWLSYEDAARADRTRYVEWAGAMIERGVFVMPEGHGRWHISAAHTAADIAHTIAAAREAFASVAPREERR